MKTYRWIALIASVATAGTAGTAFAQEAVQPTDAQRSAPVDAAFGAASIIAETDLGKVTGREDTGAMIANATQRNTVSNNSVIGTSTTGTVRIDGNAFQNLQGLAVISANSGNNVAMNSAMNVTVNLAPR
jgi:hypothetical protein